MSSDAPVAALPRPRATRPPRPSFRAKRAKPGSPLTAHGEPLLWLTGGALVISLAMIICLLALVLYQGFDTFWPQPVVEVKTSNGSIYMGELSRPEDFRPSEAFFKGLPEDVAKRARAEMADADGQLHRRLLRSGNYDLTNTHFHWIEDCQITSESRPEWAIVVERLSWGRFYGIPVAFVEDEKEVATGAEQAWAKYDELHAAARKRWKERVTLEKHELGVISHRKYLASLEVKEAELDYGKSSPQYAAAEKVVNKVQHEAEQATAEVLAKIDKLKAENARQQLKLKTAQGQEKLIQLDEIVRAYPANQLGWADKVSLYFSRWGEFVWDDPREANSEGGVFPAIFGTVMMTLLMSIAVVPFGVLAALYLREYAQPGLMVSMIRIAINNLAGVPSIVFGVFGLGFFCYVMGASIDQLFFRAALASNVPTFGTGGLLWASLTLAILTLPVVIITTEEALAAVPGSMREGSYACGASKWQTIQRIVLPRALPGIMTGMILAMARGAGEVAPLMLVGAVKLAPELPVDGIAPFIHAQRSFMHLGFHLFDLGFQSSNSEAAKPMVYTTTLLLIGIIAFLNIAAVWLRARLRRKFVASHF
jgi:phosphate transport system permease protein